MIGAIQGLGRLSVSSICESPLALAGKRPVETLTVVGLPAASLLKQLTIALKFGLGFVPPRPLAMTAGSFGSSTRPETVISNLPLAFNSPVPEEMTQGKPPPRTPRIAFVAPV